MGSNIKNLHLTELFDVVFVSLLFLNTGSNLIVHGRKFEIVSADERVLKYINENEVPPLPKHTQASLRQYFLERGYHVKE